MILASMILGGLVLGALAYFWKDMVDFLKKAIKKLCKFVEEYSMEQRCL